MLVNRSSTRGGVRNSQQPSPRLLAATSTCMIILKIIKAQQNQEQSQAVQNRTRSDVKEEAVMVDRIRTRVEGRRVRVHHTQEGNPFGEWRPASGRARRVPALGPARPKPRPANNEQNPAQETARQAVIMEHVEKVQEGRRTGRKRRRKRQARQPVPGFDWSRI